MLARKLYNYTKRSTSNHTWDYETRQNFRQMNNKVLMDTMWASNHKKTNHIT